MSEQQKAYTMNGQEITKTREKLNPSEFKEMIEAYGLRGSSPEERVQSLKNMSPEAVAIMITDINRRLQGSDETMVNETTMKIGNQPVVPEEYRYDLYMDLMSKISNSSTDINYERIADALSLGIVILHPFKDGNGRTSRTLRLVFDPSYDNDDYTRSFEAVSESRDISRARGGSIVLGYVPNFKEGQDQSDPNTVEEYFIKLFTEDDERLYVGTYGYASVKNNIPVGI